jgi:MYXO-CTERM domain-containing protein
MNQFQGRYIIRHEWEGKVECENPQYGIWGGPNGSDSPQMGSAPSANTEGRAPQFEAEDVSLGSLVKQEIPEVGVRPGEARKKSTSKSEAGGESMPKEGPKSTCAGCVSAPETGGGAALVLFVVGGLALGRRRSRKAH